MHVIVTWDISAQGETWTRLNEDLKLSLSGLSWVRPLSTFYIVQVGGEVDRQRIFQTMLRKAQAAAPGQITFLIGPVIGPTEYTGYVAQNLWNEINMRTRA